jgi:hypothetical protein
MGVPHGISRPRKGKARGCAQASVPHQCATARPLRCSPLSHAREERTHRAPRVGAPPTATRPRARAPVRKAGGRGRLVVPHRVSSGPTCPHGPPAATTCRPPRGRCRVSSGWPCPYERGARWEGNRLHKQSKRVASRRPRRSLPCTGHVSCCGSETPRAGPWVVGAVAVPQKQAVGGRGGAHWSSGRPHVRARTAQGERGVMGRTARIVREGGRTE